MTRLLTLLLALLLSAACAASPVAESAETWVAPLLAAVPSPPQSPPQSPPTSSHVPPGRGRSRARPPARPAPRLPFPTVTSGDSAPVELGAGPGFPAFAEAIPPERIDRTFVRIGAADRPMPLTGARAAGNRTRLEATYAGVGLATVAVQLLPSATTLDAAAFGALLEETGSSAAAQDRLRRKETRKKARVVVQESARAFVGVAPAAGQKADPPLADAKDAPVGLPLELVAGAPPLPLRAGAVLPATLLLDGRPLPDVAVRLYGEGGDAPSTFTTDADGRVRVPLAHDGSHLLAAAFARRTTKADRTRGDVYRKADWELLRTTLRLSVLPPAPRPAPPPRKKAPAKRP